MPAPRVSVALAVHNGEQYLAEAVRSILTQSFSDFELIAVDDGSTDRSGRILQDAADQDRRVRILHHEQTKGLPRSLNCAIGSARGEFVARMDADDISLSRRFDRQVSFLDANSECLAVGCRILVIDEDGDPLWREKQAETHEGIEWVLLRGMGGIPHPGAMFRRDAFVAVGGYREKFPVAQDIDLWLRLGEKGRLANVTEILLKYRRHFAAASWQKYELQRETVERVLREAYDRRGLPVPDDPTADIPLPRTALETRLEWSRRAAWDGFTSSARKHAYAAFKTASLAVPVWKAVLRAWYYSIKPVRVGL